MMRRIFLTLATLAILALTATPALAQCSSGNCRNAGFVRSTRVVAAPARVARQAAAAPVRLLGSTRFFDGDGRPLRKAR